MLFSDKRRLAVSEIPNVRAVLHHPLRKEGGAMIERLEPFPLALNVLDLRHRVRGILLKLSLFTLRGIVT